MHQLIPLLILFVVLAIGAFIGYGIYSWSNELAERGKKKMEKKHMAFTKEGGLRVGVKEMKDEAYADRTQNVLVNVWNNAELPNYKSRLGWNSTQGKQAAGGKSSSSEKKASSAKSTSSNSPANLSASQQRPAVQRAPSSSTPGGWE